MTKTIDDYTKEEFEKQFQRFRKNLSAGFGPQSKPSAFLLGGQSGAGKTRPQKILMDKHGYDFIVINGDEYRSAHRKRDVDQFSLCLADRR